jgi:acetolactate synthase-1/2/3 large subunit
MNNGVLGMVRQWQKVLFEKRFSNTTLNRKTDFVKLAEAFGAKGLRIENENDIEKVLKEALNANCPVIIDCIIPSDDNVLPMIPAGKSLEDVITVIDN